MEDRIFLAKKIQNLRKEKNLTQRELADKLGVSEQAVSKWETGHSYPDITLLCPLARALGTNVDSLLQFEETISDTDVANMMNDILELARQEGYEAAEQKIFSLLRQYPNLISLKFNAAVVWNTFVMFFPSADEETRRQWTAHKKRLLTEVRASGDAAYWQTATLQLAGIAIAEGALEEGEQLLNELPEQIVDPTITKSLLYLRKEEPEEALKITQKRLFSLIHQVRSCLLMMLDPKIIDDMEQTMQIFEVYKAVDELFGLGHMYDGILLDIYVRMNRYEEAADCLVRYVDVILGEAVTPKEFLFSPGLEIKKGIPATTEEMRQMLLKGLNEEPYAKLLQYPRCQAAIEKIRD